ncbi:MAG TPA: EVE domain-containing protein [Gemmatimonadaceae bacterium]|nr:EVE domain-containing protein [Gemmatimonadaceae bacterium]
MSERHYWLVKTEPSAFSFDDLVASPRKTTGWDGVRNYQARNFMRDGMQQGDLVLFYHSNADPTAVMGVARVVREAYPDPTAFDRNDSHYDAKSTLEAPTWMMVDLQAVERFTQPVALGALRGVKGLEKMALLQKGSRLSVQPVTAREFEIVRKLGAPAAV